MQFGGHTRVRVADVKLFRQVSVIHFTTFMFSLKLRHSSKKLREVGGYIRYSSC